MNNLFSVGLQILTIAYIASTGPVVPTGNTILHVLFLAGLVLLAWAAWLVYSQNKLVTWGPYHHIRHPMFAGLLLSVGSMTAYLPTYDRSLAFGILFLTLWQALSSEERLLAKRFPAYKVYMKKTKRLIPYIL